MNTTKRRSFGLGLLGIFAAGALVATGCTVDAESEFRAKDQAIMGGSLASNQEYPWMVQLMRRNATTGLYEHWCGGSLIAGRWVLTAAHCLHENKDPEAPLYPTSEFRVTLNEQNWATNDGSEQFVNVSNFITHEGYHSDIYTNEDDGCIEFKQAAVNDVGLVQLSTAAQLGAGVQIVRLAESDYDVGDASWLSGWGTSDDGTKALKELQAEIRDVDTCQVKDMFCDRDNTADEICTHNPASDPGNGHPEAGCYGDSGSPWIVKPAGACVEQIGIHSRGQSQCVGPNVPVRVASYVPWIHQKIDSVYEAESMTHTTGNAYAGGWNLYDGNGYAAFSHTFTGGQQRLIVRAAGTFAGNAWPTMEVRIGSAVTTVQLTSASWTDYPVTLAAPNGSGQVQVRFTNDYFQNGADRNLLLDKVTVVNLGHGAGCVPSAGAFSATLQVYDDWGAGYCARVRVTNAAAVPTTNWTVVVSSGNSSVNQRWNTTFISGTGNHDVRPIGWNNAISPGVTSQDTGFCALRAAGTTTLPTIVSATATY